MAGELLLDTNAVIALFERDQGMLERVRAANAVYVPVVVLGELYYGARKSHRVDANIARVEEFLDGVIVPACDEQTAELFGVIKKQLQLAGQPVPDNDVWVAATARQLDATLISRDQHFASVESLSWESW